MKNKFLITVGIVLAVTAFSGAAAAQSKPGKATPMTQLAKVQITKMGYEPVSLRLKRGIPARITFQRMTDSTCGTEIVIPDYGINRPLPLYEKVVVSFTPRRSGEVSFTCGMNMLRGKIVVR